MAYYSIGDVAERCGINPVTLRAWQRRYGLLKPQRSEGGHRLFDEEDIQRIEEFRAKGDSFVEGYTIFITNEMSYKKAPTKKDCVYAAFSLEEGITKTGNMDWSPEASEGTKKGCENPINLTGAYLIHWDKYSCVDTSKEGTFIWTMAKIMATEPLLTP